MKSEPDVFSIDDLNKRPKKTEHWDGVRNYQARNNMQKMKKGDLCFFYHSNAKPIGIAGVCEVVREAYPDHTAFDENSKYYDAKSTLEKPRWFMVDVKFKQKFKNIVTRDELKELKSLKDMELFKNGRLSVSSVRKKEWDAILKLSN